MRRIAPLILLLASSTASAEDRWSSPHAGVSVLERRAPGPREVRAVFVDLCTPELHVRATRPSERGLTTSAFAAQTGALVAINGDFVDRGFAPVGLAMGEGERWPDAQLREDWSLFGAGPGRAGVLYDPRAPWPSEAIGGVPQIVLDGVAVAPYESLFCRREHPRSALGIDREGRTLIFAIVDGRSASSVGATCAELAALMAELGAWQAINLDGGGSSALFVEGRGVINRPSDGAERAVANHLAIVRSESGGVDACPSDGWRARPSSAALPSDPGALSPVSSPAESRSARRSDEGLSTERGREPRVEAPSERGPRPWVTLTAACAVLVLGAAAWRTR